MNTVYFVRFIHNSHTKIWCKIQLILTFVSRIMTLIFGKFIDKLFYSVDFIIWRLVLEVWSPLLSLGGIYLRRTYLSDNMA